MKPCTTCYFLSGGMCVRPMRLRDGEERLLPRYAFNERKLKHPEWKRMKRPPDDICGETAKYWRAK